MSGQRIPDPNAATRLTERGWIAEYKRQQGRTRANAKPFERPVPEGPPATATQMYALSAAFALGSVAALMLALVYMGLGCPSDTPLLKVLCTDSHYKYLVPLLVPVTAWFTIANWVGWQFFRYS